MAVVLRDGPSRAKPSDIPTKSPPIDREGALSRFHESVGTIAGLLGDISTPLRRCAHNRDRFLVEDGFAYTWKEAKQQLGRGDDETAKAILRAQGASAPFMEAIRNLLRVEVATNSGLADEHAKRFSVALRFATHLAPDGGEQVYKELDKALHPSHSSCPLRIVNAYLAHKVRNAPK